MEAWKISLFDFTSAVQYKIYFIYHFIFLRNVIKGYGRLDKKSFWYKYIRYKLKLFRDIIEVDSIQLNLQARSRGRDRGARAPPEIFRFELNSASKVKFCLLEWTAVNWSYSFQVLSIIAILCTVVLLCNLELCEGTKSYFCSAKNQQPSNISLFFIKIDWSKNGWKCINDNPWTWPLGLFWFLRGPPV